MICTCQKLTSISDKQVELCAHRALMCDNYDNVFRRPTASVHEPRFGVLQMCTGHQVCAAAC